MSEKLLEKINGMLTEGKVKKFKKATPFSKSTLHMVGAGMDTNGNHVVSIKFPNDRAFTIQTDGNLETAHRELRGIKDYNGLSDSIKKSIEGEIVNYIKQHGSKVQKDKLKLTKGE